MKMPRTFKILALMFQVLSAVINNERFLVKKNLQRLDKLGGIYIKFLQILILSLPPKNKEEYKSMLTVYENSPPDNINIYKYLAGANICCDNFASICDKPFATGSFGQVYKAVLTSGEQVIIKVLRPSVTRYLSYDLRLINLLCFIYSILDKQKVFNYRQVYKDFKKTCIEETNYLREVEIAEYYYRTYENHSNLVIPRSYPGLSNSRVIVQEYIEGISLAAVLDVQLNGYDGHAYVKNYLASDLFVQLYTVGFELISKALVGNVIQSDPHPGNIILLPGNKVALIDFGMVAEVSDNRVALYEMLLQYKSYYADCLAIEDFTVAAFKYLAPDLYAAIKEADKLFRQASETTDLLEGIKKAARATSETDKILVERYLKKRMIMKALLHVVNKGNRFGLSLDLKAFGFLKAAQTYLSLVGRFDHSSVIIAQVINDVIVYAEHNFDEVVGMSEEGPGLKPAEALEILSSWFDKMARKDPWLMYDLAGGYLK